MPFSATQPLQDKPEGYTLVNYTIKKSVTFEDFCTIADNWCVENCQGDWIIDLYAVWFDNPIDADLFAIYGK